MVGLYGLIDQLKADDNQLSLERIDLWERLGSDGSVFWSLIHWKNPPGASEFGPGVRIYDFGRTETRLQG